MAVEEEETGIKIPITAEADVSGFEETRQAAEEMQAAVEGAANATVPAMEEEARQTQQVAAAKEKEKKASEEAAVAEEKLRRAMELAKKSRNELIKELQRLAKARREAAVAGDKEAFDQLSAQSAETREAFEKLNQGLELTNIQFVQQAQMGMMAGQTLAGIGQMAEGGASSVAGMAAGFLSLGQAIKAGLGPIGWAMMALQGLQMAWDYFAKKQEEAAKAAKEADEAMAKLNDTLLQHAEAANKVRYSALKEFYDKTTAAAETAADREIAAQDRKKNAEDEAAAHRLELLRGEADREKNRLRMELELGKITQTQYDADVEALEGKLRETERLEAESARKRQEFFLSVSGEAQKSALRTHQEFAERLSGSLPDGLGRAWNEFEKSKYAELTGKYDEVKELIKAGEATRDTINAAMEAEKANNDRDYKLADWRRQRAENEKLIAGYTAQLLQLDQDASDNFSDIMKAAAKTEQARGLSGMALLRHARSYGKQIEDAQEAVRTGQAELDETQRELNELKTSEVNRAREVQAAQDAQLAADRKAAELRVAAAAREEEWGELQRKSPDEQKVWLEAQLKRMVEGNELWEDYNKRLRSVNDALVGERLSKLKEQRTGRNYTKAEERTQEEALAADRAILNERLRKLRAELAGGQDLTHAMRKDIAQQITATERELLGLAQAEVRDRLARLNEKTTTQQYAVRDRRTQRQIMEADAAILAARRDELRRLLEAPGLDEATRAQMTKALRDTQKQISGLKEAWAQNRDASARWLSELTPPKIEAKRGMQRNVDAAARNFAKLAKQAQAAQAAGDSKALERYRKEMRGLADDINEHAKDWRAGTKLYQSTEEALRACSHELTKLDDAVVMSREAAQKWVKELEPPKLHAKAKDLQWGLDAAAKSYARVAKQAAVATAAGDTKAAERYGKEMQRLAAVMNERASDAGAGTRLQKKADAVLRGLTGQQAETAAASREATRATQRKAKAAVATAVSDTRAAERYGKEMQRLAAAMNERAGAAGAGTRLQKQADAVLRGLTGQQEAMAAASREATRATQRKSKAEKQAASATEKSARDAKRREVGIGELRGELTALTRAMRRMESGHGRLQAKLTLLVDAVTACANAAGGGVSAVTGAVRATNDVTARLQGQIKTLQKQVDRLNRKI